MSEQENLSPEVRIAIEEAATAGNNDVAWTQDRVDAVFKHHNLTPQGQKELASVEKDLINRDADVKAGLGLTALNVSPETKVSIDNFASNEKVDQERLNRVQNEMAK